MPFSDPCTLWQARAASDGPAASPSQVSDLSEFRNSKSRHCGGEGPKEAREGERRESESEGEGESGGKEAAIGRPREEWMER